MSKREIEVRIAREYYDEMASLGEKLSSSQGSDNKRLKKEVENKLEIYSKQIMKLKDEFPDDEEILWLASFEPHFKALTVLCSEGFMRRVTGGDHGISTKIAAGMIAKSQEKKSMNT